MKFLILGWQKKAKSRIFKEIFDEIYIFWRLKNAIFCGKILGSLMIDACAKKATKINNSFNIRQCAVLCIGAKYSCPYTAVNVQ